MVCAGTVGRYTYRVAVKDRELVPDLVRRQENLLGQL